MIDLHTHILPGVDDGVQSEDEAVEFARHAAEDGTTVMVATPHCREGFFFNDRDAVMPAVDRLRARLEQENVELRLETGAEVHIAPELIERIGDGRAPTLCDNGKTLLLELSLSQYPVSLEELMFQLRLAGIEILLAHPERIRYFQDDVKRYEAVVRLGAYGQVTTGSLRGQFGRDTQRFAEDLMRRGLVHVIASDAHNMRGRKPGLSHAVEAAIPLVGEERALSMVNDVPQALLEGREPDVPPVEQPRGRAAAFFSLKWLGRR